MPPSAESDPAMQTEISEDEIALYDRQIRLWGMQAQEKIRRANILLITLRALGSEISKNLVLAGISSLTILDPNPVSTADLGAGFFLSQATNAAEGLEGLEGKSRAEAAAPIVQKLNPRVKVRADSGPVREKDAAYFASFDVVIATDLGAADIAWINDATRAAGKKFYAAGCHGTHGFIFSDLVSHSYVIQRDSANVVTKPGPESATRAVVDVRTKKEGPRVVETVTKRETYSPFGKACLSAPLPAEFARSKRRLRAVSPVLSCLRALWSAPDLADPSSRAGMESFTRTVMGKHAELGLPPETLTPEVIRQFLQGVGAEIAPVAAILGGQLAQDVINVLGQTQQPIQNTVVFDGGVMEASVYALHSDLEGAGAEA
ncbi:related to NEDD8-activating enzyme E1 regulatory subunit [Cephalotrichum gorgonifer]|uniref:Ubiquitin-like 1-activating enzyme E1A n=1 Tax=Cephalotrichum gorgonifer TaxID=2041049 RepID=A0AAE8MQY2_9PEZI|nr:related to NEDD8-activating enzyme E1 regulatory subunit [Cephalotrichum gorgonifer]